MGVDFHEPQSGYCGMAGAFGFEKDHYEVSIACGERVLLPEVRKAAKDSLIIADGFSCREQIRQQTGRRALHVAQVLQMARDEGPRVPAGNFPEQSYVAPEPAIPSLGKTLAWLALGALVAWSALGWTTSGKSRR